MLLLTLTSYTVLKSGDTYPSNLKPLLTAQKKLIRTISFSQLRAHSPPLFQMWNILPLRLLINLKTAETVYRYIHNNNILMNSRFQPVIHSYETRNSLSGLFIPRVNTNYGKHSIHYSGSIIWNSIPAEIRLSTSLSLFKHKLFNYYIQSLDL